MRVFAVAVVAALASVALASSSFASGGYSGGFRPPVVKKPAKPSESQNPEKKKKKTGDAQTVRPAAIG
ncbi:hypothetical protein [uncultured Hyphomicrobium sp.]|jgi:hypothetical protein|uniref:hypothetical protein n=1 Tax=uncultured Hyphomicrobium sp. TaxID=194373 RepID=UPI0025CD6E2A|nr:hypothetical protein [uncultured Hyphomicrobium sp.]